VEEIVLEGEVQQTVAVEGRRNGRKGEQI